MALTLANVKQVSPGNYKLLLVNVTLDSSYATGGESLAATDLGLYAIYGAIPITSPQGWAVAWDNTNLKFLAYGTGTSTGTAGDTIVKLGEAPSTTNLSSVTFMTLVIGQ